MNKNKQERPKTKANQSNRPNGPNRPSAPNNSSNSNRSNGSRKTNDPNRRIRRKKRIVRKFLLIVGSITGVYLLIASIVTISLLARSNPSTYTFTNPYIPQTVTPVNNDNASANLPPVADIEEAEDDSGFLRPPARTNVLVLGIDEIGLADVVIVASFERDTGNVNLLHIPRDTFTQLPPHRIENMRSNGLWVPADGIMRINALRSWGREFGIQYTQEQLSETLGIHFHYYVEVSTAAFRSVVDLVGGVEIEVPRRLVYNDPYQDLFINIPPGLQLMDGRMAEHFVRYRTTYANADLGRINAQQQFLTQMFRQVLRRETIMNNLPGLAQIAIGYVQTDFGLDVVRYIPYTINLSPDRIFTYTLPGRDLRLPGGWYYIPDVEQVPELVNRMFFGITEVQTEIDDTAIQVMAQPSPYRNARISVLNGADIGGVASNIADRLYMDGYNVVYIGIYTGNRQNQTRIYVREEGQGEDLLEYFENAVIRVNSRMSQDIDVNIIVGRSQQ
ncbi:MAG: LCP family protein [Defluviitaleaceae bacterium]|nr:LCP family protein [Defluviitaleaceae bacterium]